jgi:hypothetical protein
VLQPGLPRHQHPVTARKCSKRNVDKRQGQPKIDSIRGSRDWNWERREWGRRLHEARGSDDQWKSVNSTEE